MIEITPGLSEYLKRGDGILWHVPRFHCKQETTQFFFKSISDLHKKKWLKCDFKITSMKLNLQTRAPLLIITDRKKESPYFFS